MVQCVDHGRYHNPDWNAEPADKSEFLATEKIAEMPSISTTTSPHQLVEN